ncbi:hypothetical protein FRC12_002289 [Ceratobasidium sp. 428]|nr:hypothetical protein FRC12_002289 [Ceratobasidium sp. 428]
MPHENTQLNSNLNSSPSPVRATQPQPPDSPTTTARGTVPHHALYDTPPEGEDSQVLGRSERKRTISHRLRESREYKEREQKSKPKPPASQSNTGAAKSKSKPRPASHVRPLPFGLSIPRFLVTPPSPRFDGETDSNAGTQPGGTRDPSSPEQSPPPKPPGRGPGMARGGRAEQRSGAEQHSGAEHSGAEQHGRTKQRGGVVVNTGTARELGDLFGIDFATATEKEIQEAVRTVPNSDPLQVGTASRYPAIRSEASAPIPSLNQKGEYYRDRHTKLGSPRLKDGRKRVASPIEERPGKRRHADARDESGDEPMLDDSANEPPPASPALPFRFLPSQFSHSASSTQNAVVNAFASQRDAPTTLSRGNDAIGYRASPVPQPNDIYTQFAAKRRLSQQQAPAHEPPPLVTTPNTSGVSFNMPIPDPEPRNKRKAPPTRPTATSKSTPNARPNVNTATEDESDPVPLVKPKKKSKKKKSKNRKHKTSIGDGNSPNPQQPRSATHAEQPAHQDNETDTETQQRRDVYTLLSHLNQLLDDGVSPDNDAIDSLTRQVFELTGKRHSGQHLSTNSNAGPSSSRTRSNPSSSPEAGSSSSRAQHDPSSRSNRPSTQHGRLADGPPSDDDGSDDSSSDDDPDDDYDPVCEDRTGLARYPGRRGKVASRAIPILLVNAVRKGMYQEADVINRWGLNAWKQAWDEYCPHIPMKECPHDLLATIVARLSNLRTDVKKRVQDLVHYLFKFTKSTSEEAISANKQIAARLGHNTFHCRYLVPGKRQYEHKVYVRAICVSYFWYSNSFLLRNPSLLDRFAKEGLPLPSAAFVLTMLQECVEEWGSGCHRPRDLNLANQRAIFDAHLKGLYNYRSKAQVRMLKFQKKWFRKGLDYANIKIHEHEDEGNFCQSVTQAEDVEPDDEDEEEESSSESDSESDDDSSGPEHYGDGRLTAKSKGKGRARR